MEEKFRVNVYIDGFNFYYGLKNKFWRKYYWLDVVKFYESLMKPNQILNQVYYFSASPFNRGQKERQKKFFDCNDLNPKFNLILGKFLEKEVTYGGQTYKTYEEKETDVNLAVNLLRNIFNNSCDTSIIVSADSDLIPAIKLAKEIAPKHMIISHFPPKRHSVSLSLESDAVIHLERYEAKFKKALLDDEVCFPDSSIIRKPNTWS